MDTEKYILHIYLKDGCWEEENSSPQRLQEKQPYPGSDKEVC